MPEYKTANPRKKIPAFTLGKILSKCEQERIEPWVQALTVLLWVFGIRIGEAEKLRKLDFVIKDGYLWVDCPPEKNPNKPDRVLPISLNTPHLKVLIDYVGTLEPDQIFMPMHRTTYWRRLKKMDEELSAHVFRHNRTTQISLTKPHEFELQSWLGHADTRMSHKYMHESGVFAIDLGKRLKIEGEENNGGVK